jgi:Tat protein secretion system quality control protein TatD with DNase activity
LKGVVGMPTEIEKVVDTIAELRGYSATFVAQTVHNNFLRLVASDPWLKEVHELLCGIQV